MHHLEKIRVIGLEKIELSRSQLLSGPLPYRNIIEVIPAAEGQAVNRLAGKNGFDSFEFRHVFFPRVVA
jgi:hypothetical protein